MYHAPRGKGFFLPWLTFHLWAKKIGFFVKSLFGEEKLDFRVLLDVSLPRRRCESSQGRLVLHLSEGMVRISEGVRLGVGMYAKASQGQNNGTFWST